MLADDRVIENIKKLQSLGMPENEIVENLVKMGLSKENSKELINKSKDGDKKVEKIEEIKDLEKEEIEPTSSEIPDEFFESNQKLPENKIEEKTIIEKDFDITDGLEMDKLNKSSKDQINSLDLETDIKPKESTSFDTPDNETNSDFWKTGTITTINAKLNELDKKQQNFEEYIKAKVESELKKVNSIQESSQQLIISKIDNAIKDKVAKQNVKIITELTKFKITEAKINTKINTIEEDKKKLVELTTKLEERNNEILHNIDETKKQTDMIVANTESNISKIISTITIKLNDKIKEINNTLALQSRITQGLVKNTQQSIDKELKKINDFGNKLKSQIDPKKLYDKIQELDNFKQTLANRYDERFETVKIEFLNKAKGAMKLEIQKELDELKKVREEIANKTDPKKLDDKLAELKVFEEHLLSSIDEKISQSLKIYESSISQEFKLKMKEINQFEKKLEKEAMAVDIIDEKIKEVDRFKKQFIAVIDQNIEKMNKNMQILNQKVEEINQRK